MKCFWVFCDWPSCDHSCCYQASSSNGCSCQLLHVCVSVCTFFSLIYLFFVLFLVFGCCFLCWLVSELFGLTVIWCNVRCDYHACVTEYSTMLHFSLCDWTQHYVPFLVVRLNTALCSISRCVTEYSTMFHFSLKQVAKTVVLHCDVNVIILRMVSLISSELFNYQGVRFEAVSLYQVLILCSVFDFV